MTCVLTGEFSLTRKFVTHRLILERHTGNKYQQKHQLSPPKKLNTLKLQQNFLMLTSFLVTYLIVMIA